MIDIQLTGTGTSQGVPVIGCDCEVCSSSAPKDQRLRASCLIQSKTTTIVIDTGPDFRRQMLDAGVKKLDAVVFTHEHKDHTAGLDDIRPFYFRQEKEMDIYASSRVIAELKQAYHYAFAEKKYPGAPGVSVHEIEEEDFQIGDIRITPIPLMHGSLAVLGFRIGNFAYLTDVNFIPESSMAKLQGLEILVLDALHHKAHYSHFTLKESIAISQELQPGQTWFTHINHQMGLHEEVNKDLSKGMALAWDGLCLKCE